MFRAQKQSHPLLWSFFCGLLLVLSYPPASLWVLSLPAFGLLSWYLFEEFEGQRFKDFFKVFFVFSLVVKGFSLYWIPHTLIEFSTIPLVVAWLLGVLGLSLMSLPSALAGALLLPLVKKWIQKKSSFRIPLIFLFWILWDICDYRFFPWIPAQSFGSQKYLLASVGVWGTWGWNYIFYALVAFLHSLKKQPTLQRVFVWGSSCVFVLFVAGFIGFREIKKLQSKYKYSQKIAILQGAVGNFEKKLQNRNESPTNENVLRIYRDLVERLALKQKNSEIKEEYFAFWPETAFPGFPINDSSLSEQLSSWSRLTNAFHLIGAYEERAVPALLNPSQSKIFQYNIVTAYSAKGDFRGHYQKVVRMPFGEYVPGDQYYPWIYEKFSFLNQFGKGERSVALLHDHPKGPAFIPFICFEILNESYVREAVLSARKDHPDRDLVLVNPTNDSWFGEGAELFLHSHLARWQVAREQVPLVRPTNTGLSMVIAPWGEVLTQGRVGVEALILTELPLSTQWKP